MRDGPERNQLGAPYSKLVTLAQSNSEQVSAILDEAYIPGAAIHTECLG